MYIGFLTFGGATLGFVLNNYASSDSLISFARLAIGGALLSGYPFTFSALREGTFLYMYICIHIYIYICLCI
jgi:hypothetical protein